MKRLKIYVKFYRLPFSKDKVFIEVFSSEKNAWRVREKWALDLANGLFFTSISKSDFLKLCGNQIPAREIPLENDVKNSMYGDITITPDLEMTQIEIDD